MRISIYLLTTSHTHLLLTTPTLQNCHPYLSTSVQYGCAEVWMTILESGWNLWVWLVGVVSRRWVWLVLRRYIDILTKIINFPYSTCISSFLASASLLLRSLFKKMFFRSCKNKNKNKKPKWRFLTSRGTHLNCAIMAMLYTHRVGRLYK